MSAAGTTAHMTISEGDRYRDELNNEVVTVQSVQGDIATVEAGGTSWRERVRDLREKLVAGDYTPLDDDVDIAAVTSEAAVPMAGDAQLLYPTRLQAAAAAVEVGIAEGGADPAEITHPHDLDGEEWYMPGESHQQFEDVVGADTDQEGEKLDECVESVLEDNPDLSESEAYAICNAELNGEADIEGISEEADAMTNGHDMDPETGEVTCATADETFVIENATWADLAGDCPKCGDPLSMVDVDSEAGVGAGDAVDAKASTIDAIALRFPPGGEVIDHDEDDWTAFLDALAEYGDVFQTWKGLQIHPDDNLESHDHATYVALNDGDVSDIEAVLEEFDGVHYRIDESTVDAFDQPDNWDPDDDLVITEMTAVDTKAEYDTFEEGAAVRWTWDGEPVHGRVAERRPDQATVSGNTITGDEGEPVYVIDEWDDRVGAFRRENVAKPASSLNESNKDLPPRSEGNYVSEQAWESLTTSVSQSAFTPRELDYAARELDILQKSRPGEWLLPDADPVVYKADIPEKYLEDRSEDVFVPNEGVAEAARKVDRWNDEHGRENVAGGAADGEGERRKNQLIEYAERGEPLAIEYWEEIRAFHDRKHAQDAHELDSEYEGEPHKDAGYVGHLRWGGDAGYEQAQRVMDVVESVEEEAAVEMRGAVATEQSLNPRTLTKADSNEVDLDALEDELRAAVEAEDFYIYGKASIEQWDSDDPPTYIQMDALEGALDRYFDSETAPGIISRHHQDIPVGRPVRSFEFEADTTLEIDGDTYEFEAGDTATSHVEDADGDGRPELWLAANIDNETEMGKKTRVLAAQGDLNGFSVTVHRNKDELTQEGRYVTDCDLHAVTIGTDDQIKNEGSEFDVASVSSAAQRIKETILGVLHPG